MMDLDHAKTVVNHLLTATDIKAVYYVDDKFQKDAEIDDHIEKFLIAIEKCYANGQIDDFPEHVRFAGNDNLDAEVRAWWSGMTTEQKQQKFEKYVIGGAENIRPALLVREIMDNQCTCCSPSEWNNNYKAECYCCSIMSSPINVMDFNTQKISLKHRGPLIAPIVALYRTNLELKESLKSETII